ncbi:hypothetical protein [Peteryoungia algae]|uniref:Uncharacterized protein n=1 Tax=Peteryoungia algae TaxID=2919917 RepID=A0ABT0D203_9HYPH|nr:hypothetical protein [Rhizobium sp. SSM4.3]MCJ8239324.1 hypothetical protein [Rhizobium sp. SSM4.3]
MTQVVTVSAQTAAYAMESVKPPQRASRASYVEEHTRMLAQQAAQSEDLQLRALVAIVQPPALSLYFLTSTQQQFEQATLQETIEAYKNSVT